MKSFAAWLVGALLVSLVATACSDDLLPPPLNVDSGVEASVRTDAGASSDGR